MSLRPRVSVRLPAVLSPLLGLLLAVVLGGCDRGSDSPKDGGAGAGAAAKTGKPVTVAFLPKSKGNAYFVSCMKGAKRAGADLGIDLLIDGPTDPDPARQNEIIENWITLGVDVIAAACENRDGISTALRKARAKGIHVVTYDSDAQPDSREFFVNQATPRGIGYILMDEAARLCNTQGEFAVIVGSLTSANQNEWKAFIEERRAATYPAMKMAALRACDDLKDKAQSEATAMLAAYPNLKMFVSTTSLGVPGSAEAVKQAGKGGKVKVIGLGLPNENRRYVKEGITDDVILWKSEDLGELTVRAAVAVARGTLKPGDRTFAAGKLGEFRIEGDNVLLGQPFIFNRENIDQFDF